MRETYVRIAILFLIIFHLLTGNLYAQDISSPPVALETDSPYIAHYRDQNKHLWYIATLHSHDTESPTFQLIQQTITSQKPNLVILEGIPAAYGVSPKTITQKIKQKCWKDDSGMTCEEPLYAASLAVQSGIPFIGAEPTDQAILAELQGHGFSREDFIGFYFTRQLAQYYREGIIVTQADLPEAFENFRVYLQKYVGVIAFSYEQYLPWFEKKMGQPFVFEDVIDPAFWASRADGHFIQQMANHVEQFRDKHIMHVILSSLGKYQRILVVFGAGHYVAHRKILDEKLGRPEITHP